MSANATRAKKLDDRKDAAQDKVDSLRDRAMKFFAEKYGLHSLEEVNARFPREAVVTTNKG